MEMENISTLENNLAIFYKVKHTLFILLCISTPRNLSKRKENLIPCKFFYMNVHSSFILKCQNLETAHMSINR